MSTRATSTPLVPLTAGRLPAGVGRKAAHLAWLATHGFRIPDGWAIPADLPLDALAGPLGAALEPGVAYAVRSSADVEDDARHTFAGQFRSLLDVTGPEAVFEAVAAVRASAGTPGVAAYARDAGIDPARIRMGVVVQRMAAPRISGVAFSRNPLTGLDEVVVEAVPGRGDALVQDGATPDRWIHRWGAFTERPETPRSDETLVAEVVRETRRIAAAYGRPVDLEWVHDGAMLWWVQVRPIAGIGDVGLYSSRIAREVLPGLIPPLVWSVNVPVVNRAWVDLFTEAIGPNAIDPERLARPFAYRAYFDMRAIGEIFVLLGMPRDSLELLLGLPTGSERPRFRPTAATWRHLPRMLRLAWRLNRYERRLARDLPAIERAHAERGTVDLVALDEPALLARVGDLMALARRVSYANIVTPLLMNLYGSLLRRRLDRLGLDGTRVDPATGLPGVHAFDPRHAIAELGRLVDVLPAADLAALESEGPAALERDGCAALRTGLDAFLARFGHLSESGNDFSRPRWRDRPDLVLRLVLAARPSASGATSGTGGAATSDAGTDTAAATLVDALARTRGLGRATLRLIAGRAGRFRLHREAVSFQQGLGHALFRATFLEFGRRLTARGALTAPDDVFLLTLTELQEVATGSGPDLASLAAARRAEMALAADLELPETIIGDDFVPRAPGAPAASLRGVPTSRGTYRGRVRVIRSTDEFDRLAPGEVLVVPHSDVAWTPLFARAGAVVAASGGMLSHSSIVARERGIPCVVSVPDSLRLADGALVHVDGFGGVVTVEESGIADEVPAATA